MAGRGTGARLRTVRSFGDRDGERTERQAPHSAELGSEPKDGANLRGGISLNTLFLLPIFLSYQLARRKLA